MKYLVYYYYYYYYYFTLCEFGNAAVSMVSILPLISCLLSLFSTFLGTVPRTPTTIVITVIFMLYSFFSSQARFKYLSSIFFLISFKIIFQLYFWFLAILLQVISQDIGWGKIVIICILCNLGYMLPFLDATFPITLIVLVLLSLLLLLSLCLFVIMHTYPSLALHFLL